MYRKKERKARKIARQNLPSKQANPRSSALTERRVARYDVHRKMLDDQAAALDRLDTFKQEGLVPLVPRRDRVNSHRVGDRELPDSRDVPLDTCTHSVSVGSPVFLLVDNLGKPAVGRFDCCRCRDV